MPTPTALGDVYEAVIHMTVEGQEVLNVLHFQTIQAHSNVEDKLLKALLDCIVALMPSLSAQSRFIKVTCKQVTPILGPILELAPTAAQAQVGASAGDASVSFASCLISKRTTRGGRSGRGRMFIGGIPEAALAGSSFIPENPYYVAIIAFIACVVGKFVQTTELPGAAQFHQLGVMSRKLGGAKPPFAAAGFARVVSLTPSVLVKSTISRKVGRGS